LSACFAALIAVSVLAGLPRIYAAWRILAAR
jgi:hypothetical protein